MFLNYTDFTSTIRIPMKLVIQYTTFYHLMCCSGFEYFQILRVVWQTLHITKLWVNQDNKISFWFSGFTFKLFWVCSAPTAFYLIVIIIKSEFLSYYLFSNTFNIIQVLQSARLLCFVLNLLNCIKLLYIWVLLNTC